MNSVFKKLIKVSTRRYRCGYHCDMIIKRCISRKSENLAKLAEVGRLEAIKTDGKYETGQLFLHRIFGYRGVVLFPWTARVYDRDMHNPSKTRQKMPIDNTTTTTTTATATTTAAATGLKITSLDKEQKVSSTNATADSTTTSTKSAEAQTNFSISAASSRIEPSGGSSGANSNSSNSSSSASESNAKEVKGKVHTFYQVLIDSRDCPFIRAQTEAVTFLGNQDSNRSLYAIPGLDYVSHDDIFPYSSPDKHPLHHELFDKFLKYTPDRDPPFEGQDTLKAWQEKNHPWLELSDVHKETTENIRVTVIPFYMGCRETPASSVYWWRYCIRLENLGELSVQLRERHWRIFSLSGTLETVRGRGVVGQEPILSTRLPAFQYSSHVSLQASSGHMWGTFRLEREDGHTFDCKIPPFSLESKPEDASNSSGSSGQSKQDDSE